MAKYSQADVDLVRIVDAPLGAGQGADHDHAQWQAAREEAHPANILDDAVHRGARRRVQLRHLHRSSES